MIELNTELQECLNENLVQCIISNPKRKEGMKKIQIRPLCLKDKLIFQFSAYTQKQVFHENLERQLAIEKIMAYMADFQQMEILLEGKQTVVLVSKKGKVTINKKQRQDLKKTQDLSHNRVKKYILAPDKPLPFLQDLGIQSANGKIINTHYDKFRQINRFLEFIQDIVQELPKDKEAVMIDFGCGKSYLTFAMYYYLHELKEMDIRIIGLDLKADVIEKCNGLRTNYGYEKLDFFVGDIADYQGVSQVDMVVTLHACDIATDYAIAKAIEWKAKVILSVPCCQHELNQQIRCKELEAVLKYGLIKERMASLITDAIRGNVLEDAGYQVQMLEFIDMEHTPKNILIRAVKKDGEEQQQIQKKENSLAELEQLINGELTLSKLQRGTMNES